MNASLALGNASAHLAHLAPSTAIRPSSSTVQPEQLERRRHSSAWIGTQLSLGFTNQRRTLITWRFGLLGELAQLQLVQPLLKGFAFDLDVLAASDAMAARLAVLRAKETSGLRWS